AKEAAEICRRQILEVIAEQTDVPIEELTIERGLIKRIGEPLPFESLRERYRKEHFGFVTNPDTPELTFREAARIAFLSRGTIVGMGKYKPPKLGGSFKGATVGTSPAFGCSAQIAVVEVDTETGQVKIHKVIGAHDCGFAINRTMVEGQMHGSISMGMGQAIMEEVIFDKRGNILNPNLAEYKIPTSLDIPKMEAIIVETGEPNGPFGAKEVGEGAIMPTIPAILNAIYDAVGIRVTELPAHPERIARLLREAENKR
ncbi:MAG: xanthine dehydrogenase family protein molybdopterin-binding subunit, partial [bacterium]